MPQMLLEFDEALNAKVEVGYGTVHVLRFLHVKRPLSGRISSIHKDLTGEVPAMSTGRLC